MRVNSAPQINPEPRPPFFTTQAAADALGISREAVRKWCVSGKLDAHKVGKSYRISRASVREALGTSRLLTLEELLRRRRRPRLPDAPQPGIYFLFRARKLVRIGASRFVEKEVGELAARGLGSYFNTTTIIHCAERELDELYSAYMEALKV